MKIIIFTYNRPDMLKRLLKEVEDYDYHVVDDGSDHPLDFVPEDRLTKLPHLGKKFFYLIYNKGIRLANESEHNNYLFIHDDVYNVDFERIKDLQGRLKNQKYFVNFVRDNRTGCWKYPNYTPKSHYDLIHYGYFDCLGMSNRKTLHSFKVNPPPKRFKKKGMSSGVGYEITNHFNKLRVPMYTPKKSLVYHGDHESKMHPESRRKNKLISK